MALAIRSQAAERAVHFLVSASVLQCSSAWGMKRSPLRRFPPQCEDSIFFFFFSFPPAPVLQPEGQRPSSFQGHPSQSCPAYPGGQLPCMNSGSTVGLKHAHVNRHRPQAWPPGTALWPHLWAAMTFRAGTFVQHLGSDPTHREFLLSAQANLRIYGIGRPRQGAS